jgi:hypothetical protein
MDTVNGRPSANGEDETPTTSTSMNGRVWAALRLAEVRLRLPVVLVIAAVVVGRWDLLRNRWDRLTRETPAESIAGHPVSADTEYFCPMDPGVLSDWPGRCGVCNMALVRRKKGEAAMLPDGVVARMQLSPYRVQLAGIRSAPVEFRPLAREWSTSDVVTRRGDSATIEFELPPRQASWIGVGSEVRVTCSDLPEMAFAGRVRSVTSGDRVGQGWRIASVSIDPAPHELRGGLIATIRSSQPLADLEPFRSMPRNPPVSRPGEPRRLYACVDHADSTALRRGACPLDRKERVLRELGELERIRWWCPMHPTVTAEVPGATCRECGGMELRPRVVVYAPAGQVLAVPESAVVDTGERKFVFVEEMPGMFDGVEVELGARCGEFYPIVRGLDPGQRVAIAGAFLLDAETRLNPSLAAVYFGAGAGHRDSAATTPKPIVAGDGPALSSALDGLSPDDRSMAERQKSCPVTGLALGSMGAPERQMVSGRVVFLCCGGCISKLLADPGKYLAKVPLPRVGEQR